MRVCDYDTAFQSSITDKILLKIMCQATTKMGHARYWH